MPRIEYAADGWETSGTMDIKSMLDAAVVCKILKDNGYAINIKTKIADASPHEYEG